MIRSYTTDEQWTPEQSRAILQGVGVLAGEACKTCGPLGAFTPDGSGPFDCWDCGRKAVFAMPELPATRTQPFTEQWAAEVLGLWPNAVEFLPELLTRAEREKVDLVLLGARAVLVELKAK